SNFRRYDIEIPFPQRDLNIRPSQIDPIILTQQISEESLPVIPKTESGPSTKNQLLADVSPYSSLLKSHHQLQEALLERLVGQMRSLSGVEIKDRRFRLTVYPKCFVGSDAVTWLAQTQNATREAAVRIGQALVEKGILHHVTDEHPFKDEYLFYRFYEDET
ncbi:MAG: transporter, partial [Cyanobacteria bacterium P01_C01_bin.118]